MKSLKSSRHSLFKRVCALSALVGALVALASACETGGKEGDRCNPLVLQDECNGGLHCRPATCSEAYCCPTARSSADPHCIAEGCPDPDAGNEDASDAGSEGGGGEGGSDAGFDTASDASASDSSDGG